MSIRPIYYQAALRSFTPDGTLNAAADLLPYLKDLGVDYVYLCPVFREDEDEDQSVWSKRQLASQTLNPKNPYKIIDYYTVDDEFGTNDDLRAFIAKAHEVGLRVMLDLVYLHCGRNAVFIPEHPTWVETDENGKPIVGERWPFARINYSNQEVREYLRENMRMYIVDYGADGFRCDVGDAVPLDFWEDAVRYIRQFRSDFVMFDEGSKPEYTNSVFDSTYARPNFDKIMLDEAPGAKIAAEAKRVIDTYHCKNMNMMENHDIASDTWPNRRELKYGPAWVEAYHFLMYTMPGTVMLWNGNEMADNLEQCMFANRFHSKRAGINWSNLQKDFGRKRHDLIRSLNALAHKYPALTTGSLTLLSAPEDKLVRFAREGDGASLVCTLNLTGAPTEATAKGQILLVHNADGLTLAPYGFLITEE